MEVLQMEFYEIIKKRRSIRSYKSTPVKKEQIQRILEAARMAPTAANRQPYRIAIINNPKEVLNFVKQKALHEAPIAIAIFVDESQAWIREYDKVNYAFVDGAIVFEHIILAATAEGLATVWIANTDPFLMERRCNIPPSYRFLALTPLGYPAEEPKEPSRKPESDVIRFIE
jgi:nitroreductase